MDAWHVQTRGPSIRSFTTASQPVLGRLRCESLVSSPPSFPFQGPIFTFYSFRLNPDWIGFEPGRDWIEKDDGDDARRHADGRRALRRTCGTRKRLSEGSCARDEVQSSGRCHPREETAHLRARTHRRSQLREVRRKETHLPWRTKRLRCVRRCVEIHMTRVCGSFGR